MRNLLCLCLCFTFIATSCSDSSKKNQDILNEIKVTQTSPNEDLFIIDFDKLNTKSKIFTSDFFSSVDIIELESSEASFIGKINKLVNHKDMFIVLDRTYAKGVYLFDNEGRFIRKFGMRGDGPGEYSNISDFTIDRTENIIYTLDNQKQQINWYDINNGEFINSIRIQDDLTKSFRLQQVDSIMYLDAYFPPGYPANFALQSIDLKSGKRNLCWLEPVNYNKGWNEIYFTEQELFISEVNEYALMNQLLSDTIIKITSNKVQPYLAIKGRDILTTNDLNDETEDSFENVYSNLTFKNKIYSRNNYAEFGKYIYFTYFKKNIIQFLFFDKDSQSSEMTNIFLDDLVFTEDIMNTILPDFHYSDSSYVYNVIQPYKYEQLKELIKNELINENVIHELKNLNIHENSNPIILKYKIASD
ncbi:MAG: 6-bladed beta-propeller [Dysgonomonas sp.]